MITYKDIEAKAMPPEKKEQCKDDWFSYYIGRKITYIMTIPFLYTKLTPNHVTCLSIICLLIGFGLNCFAASTCMMVVVWTLYFMWSLLDGVDGNMARYRRQFSKMGDIYDTMGGYAAYVFMYFGFGIGAWLVPGRLSLIPGEYYIIIGAFSGISSIFPRLIYQKIKASFPDNKKADNVRKNKSFIRILEMNITSIAGGTMVLSLVAVLTRLMDVFTIFYALLNVAKMVLSLYIIFRDMESET